MLFLVGDVGEPIGYVFCVFPLVEFVYIIILIIIYR